jgi:hypothetical protein
MHQLCIRRLMIVQMDEREIRKACSVHKRSRNALNDLCASVKERDHTKDPDIISSIHFFIINVLAEQP